MAEAIETFSAVKAAGNTGTACATSGPYRSSRNSRVVLFVLAGTKFPADTDGSSTTWTAVSDAVPTGKEAVE